MTARITVDCAWSTKQMESRLVMTFRGKQSGQRVSFVYLQVCVVSSQGVSSGLECVFLDQISVLFFCFVFFNYQTFQVNPIRILGDTKVEKHCFRYYYHNVKPPINLLKRTKSWPPLELTCLGFFFFCLESSRLQGSICSRNTCRRLDRRAGPEDFWTRPSVCPRLPGCPTGEQHRFVSFLLLH